MPPVLTHLSLPLSRPRFSVISATVISNLVSALGPIALGSLGLTAGLTALSVILLGVADIAPLQAQEIMPRNSIPHSPIRSLSVSGYGAESVSTTLTAVQLGVEAQGKTPLTVQQEVAQRSSAVVDYLKSQSVLQLQTQAITLNPIYNYSGNEQTIVGYSASNIVSFRIETSRMGSILDEAVQRGASRIDSLQFVATDEALAEAKQLALAEAAQDAQRQADTVLRTLGLTRQAILNIQINNTPSFSPSPVQYEVRTTQASPITPIVGGEQQVEAVVTIHVSF